MLRESIGAAIRGTGRKAARTPLSVWIAVVLLVLSIVASLVSGVRELRLQAQSREALAQVKSARLAARIVSSQCFSAAGENFARHRQKNKRFREQFSFRRHNSRCRGGKGKSDRYGR